MSQYKNIITRMAADVKAGEPVVSSALTAYEDIDRVMTLFQIRKATRLVPDTEKPAAAKALAADKAREKVGQKLKPGPMKQKPAKKPERGRTK